MSASTLIDFRSRIGDDDYDYDYDYDDDDDDEP
jgi:hypothetical protein